MRNVSENSASSLWTCLSMKVLTAPWSYLRPQKSSDPSTSPRLTANALPSSWARTEPAASKTATQENAGKTFLLDANILLTDISLSRHFIIFFALLGAGGAPAKAEFTTEVVSGS